MEALKTLCHEGSAPISRLFELTRSTQRDFVLRSVVLFLSCFVENLSGQKKQAPELRMSLGAYGSTVSFTDPRFVNSDAWKRNDDLLRIWHGKTFKSF